MIFLRIFRMRLPLYFRGRIQWIDPEKILLNCRAEWPHERYEIPVVVVELRITSAHHAKQ